MNDSVYAVVAYIARYWFALLAVIIVLRAIGWLRRDAEHDSRVQRNLPDAGYIGEWAVIASEAPGMPEGLLLRAPRDGWIGGSRSCDIRLKNAGIPGRAARFFFQEDGLHVQPERSGTMLVDGEAVHREAVLRHGATLTIGGVTLQLRLFAGILLQGEEPVEEAGARRGWKARTAPYIEAADDSDEEYEYDEADEDDYDQQDDPQQDGGAGPRVELPKPAIIVRTRRNRRP